MKNCIKFNTCSVFMYYNTNEFVNNKTSEKFEQKTNVLGFYIVL